MKSGFKLLRARLSTSATALVGLSLAGCQTERTPDPVPQAPSASQPSPTYGTVTTLAIGEEDGGAVQPAPGQPYATTLAVGEEDGTGPIPVEADGGIGDGAGPPSFDGTSTTYDIGEEDDVKIFIPPEPTAVGGTPNYGQATTLAIGEEG